MALLALAAMAYGYWYGDGIIPRLSDHRGHYLVAVEDRVAEGAALGEARPRRVYLVLVDGLRADVAARLTSMQRLGAAGACRRTLVSLPTVSRPVYGTTSSGVEQARTGARNNDNRTPIVPESIWQVARTSGRSVVAFSELRWWRELFPEGFDRYVTPARADDFFALAAGAQEDLVLVHPIYVDEHGHDHGAAAPEYAAAAARADHELGGLLAAIDLTRDVIVVTADHGHSDTGGHGGDDPEIATTLTCYAGRGVAQRGGTRPVPTSGPTTLHQRSVGPLVAVLAGLRFPRHMRPGLGNEVWRDLEGPGGLPAAYLADRRAAEARFAAAAAVLPGIYAREDRAQALRGLAALVVVAAGFVLVARRRGLGARGTTTLLAWLLAVVVVHVTVYVLVRGSFELTSINQRSAWIRASMLVGLGVGAAGAIAHRVVFRDAARLAADQLTLVGLAVALTFAHAVTFGWVIGFPLPSPQLLFFPFFVAAFIIAHGAALLVTALASLTSRGKSVAASQAPGEPLP